jgi:hypothetical protein
MFNSQAASKVAVKSGVGVALAVGVGLAVGVLVCVAVAVDVSVGDAVAVGISVGATVAVGVSVGVGGIEEGAMTAVGDSSWAVTVATAAAVNAGVAVALSPPPTKSTNPPINPTSSAMIAMPPSTTSHKIDRSTPRFVGTRGLAAASG